MLQCKHYVCVLVILRLSAAGDSFFPLLFKIFRFVICNCQHITRTRNEFWMFHLDTGPIASSVVLRDLPDCVSITNYSDGDRENWPPPLHALLARYILYALSHREDKVSHSLFFISVVEHWLEQLKNNASRPLFLSGCASDLVYETAAPSKLDNK